MDEEGRGRLVSQAHTKRDPAAIAGVVEAYKACGYEIALGNPDCLLTRLSKKGRRIETSAAISLSDLLLFQWIAATAPWERALVIGNSFGFSSFLLADLCAACSVDAIDAEVEGSENHLGSEITRQIARDYYPGVQLTIGFSPGDLEKACRFRNYEFIFIDGLHTNEQLIADFEGIRELRSENSVVYCHDVGMAGMQSGWQRIKSQLLKENDEAFDLHFTSSGSTMVVHGIPVLEDFMKLCCRPLGEVYYYFGSRHVGFRTAARMLLRTLKYSSPYGHYVERLTLGLLRGRIFKRNGRT
jgi:predicted O-methyltransferase YrrM